MPQDSPIRVSLTDRLVLCAFAFGAVFWILDSILLLFIREGPLHFTLLGGERGDIYARIIVLCLFAIFGAHVEYSHRERTRSETEKTRERAIRHRFQHFISPTVANRIASGQLAITRGGKRCQSTILFADIRGFTEMSASRDADAVVAMLNDYFDRVVASVFTHDGTVDKYIGDALMAFWGAPESHGDDPTRAVRTAMAIQQTTAKLAAERIADGLGGLGVGIGISTGQVVAGMIGAESTVSYSVIGTAVNRAARLCAAAGVGQILVCDGTRQALPGDIPVMPVAPVVAKGFSDPIAAGAVQCDECSLP